MLATISFGKDIVGRGDGQNIRVWRHLWVSDDGDFFIQLPFSVGFDEMCVQELILEESRYWDVEQLCYLLSPGDVARILRTTISHSGSGDRQIWSLERS